jgi:hypothetical protein
VNSSIIKNGVRFIFLVLVQILIFKNIDIDTNGFSYFTIFIYPIFILLLPIRTPTVLVVFLGFVLGITVDVFYDSLGVHAGASVFSAFIRSTILHFLEPRGGFEVNASPTKESYGINFFFRYAAIFMFLHILVYFSLEIFTPIYFNEIFIRTVFSFLLSLLFIIIYQYLFNPKE